MFERKQKKMMTMAKNRRSSYRNNNTLTYALLLSIVATSTTTARKSPFQSTQPWGRNNRVPPIHSSSHLTTIYGIRGGASDNNPTNPNNVRGGQIVATKSTTTTKPKRVNVLERFQRNKNRVRDNGTAASDDLILQKNGTISMDFNYDVEDTIVGQDDSMAILKSEKEDEYKRALAKTIMTVSAAGLFGIGLMATKGVNSAYEFAAGYLIEQSLSIDNLFVFIMLFEYFRIPMELQGRVLSWGIGGAIALRGLMIGVGVAALNRFKSVILVFAGILIASSLNLLLEKESHGTTGVEGEDHPQHDENIMMKLTKFLFPNTSSELHGEKFFIEEQGKRIATPLFLCLVCVELSDFVFAVDSIPAVLGVSQDPLIVYASNIFAIMALRSLYTVVAKAVESFHYLKPAVALVLGFVGSKMIAEYFHVEVSTGTSLAVICSLLGSGIVASILKNESLKQTKEGSLE